MTPTLTLEEFLAQHQPDEEEPETSTPLESIAASLRTIVERLEKHDEAEREDDHQRALVDQLDLELAEKQAQIEQVRALVKPSTSKLANAIRAVIDPTVDGETAVDPSSTHNEDTMPAGDAPVEDWREFARQRGHQGSDVDSMNRSQIRTMLGIPQPVAEVQG